MSSGVFRAAVAILAASTLLSTLGNAQKEQLGTKRVLTLSIARQLIAAAEKAACAQHCQGVIAIVDDGGNLIDLERLDDTPIGAIELSIEKARTAALYQRTTESYWDSISKGHTYYTSFPHMLPNHGGVPLIVEGKVIGAIGVSIGQDPAQKNVSESSLHGPNRTEAVTNAAVEALAKIVAH